jgi:SAM-dependent methyltransferase
VLNDAERSRFGLSFDAVADAYDRVRPRYPDTLFDDVAEIGGLGDESTVLEIGCGTGIATRNLLRRGWRVLAVEPGPAMAEVARRGVRNERLEVEEQLFEAWEPRGRRFALIFSATAFHWVDPNVKWAKTAEVLLDGGHLALATNRTVSGSTFEDLYTATRALHEQHGVGMDEGPSPSAEALEMSLHAAPPDVGAVWGVADPKGGAKPAGRCFGPPVIRSYRWEQTYSARDAATLLSTYSPYLAISEDARSHLLAGVEDAVNERFNGSVTRRYLSIVAVARRASA